MPDADTIRANLDKVHAQMAEAAVYEAAGIPPTLPW